MNVLVIPEDAAKDQYILEPLVEAMMKAAGKPHARVRICTSPRLRGVAQAMKWEQVRQIISRYGGMTDLFLLIVDRDGEQTRREALDGLERQAVQALAEGQAFFAEHAWEEVEVWVLAGHRLPQEWSWAEIRAERDPKERYFDPFAKQRNLLIEPDGGRKTLAVEAAKQYSRIRRLCPQDVASLETRIRAWVESSV